MANFDVTFQARITSANPDTIRLRTEDLDSLQARLLGRADDLGSTFYDTATQFTDLMAWNIGEQTREELQVWQSAGTAIAYASSMMELWAQHVEDFKTERSKQTSEWFEFREAKKSEIPEKYQGDTITASHPEKEWGGFFGDANKCRSIYDEIVEKADGLEKREKANYKALEENAEEVAKMLREGPTKENVQKLIDAGINSWAFYNIDPSNYTMMVDNQDLTDENAVELADGLAPYWSGAKPIDENYHELMIMLSMITTNAMQAQQGGTGYRAEEMDFLKAFYDALESGNPAPNSNGVLDISATMEGDHLSDEEREQALGVVGEGLLVLSDERLGGSYDDLPESVRSVIDGPDSSGIKSGGGYNSVHTNWLEKAEGLESLFAHTHQDMEGGAEFSTRLMHTVTSQLQHIDFLGKDDGSMSGLVDIATRNEDANYAILTGDYPEGVEGGLPWTEQSAQNVRERIISELYTHDWGDEGEAARGLTEWIGDMSWSDDEDERLMAAEAMDGLMETITSKDMHDALSNTGVRVELSDGTEAPDASFTAVNGELADGFAHLFEVYIESFSSEEGIEDGIVDFGWERGDGSPWNDDSRELTMSPAERLIFLEYVMGNEDSAVRAHTASMVYSVAQTEIYLETGNAAGAGADAGVLQALVDSALHNESVNRNLDQDQEKELKRRIFDGVANTGNNALGSVPGLGVPLQSASQLITADLINSAFKDFVNATPNMENTTTKAEIERYTSARVLAEILERSDGELPAVHEELIIGDEDDEGKGKTPHEVLEKSGLLAERDGRYYIDFEGNPDKNGPSSSEVRDAMNSFLEVAEIDWTLRADKTGYDFSSSFVNEFYDNNYDPMKDQLQYSKGSIRNLYERVPANASNT